MKRWRHRLGKKAEFLRALGSCKRHRQGKGCQRSREKGATVPVSNRAGHAGLRTLSAEGYTGEDILKVETAGQSLPGPQRHNRTRLGGAQECGEKSQAGLGTLSSGFQQNQGQAATSTETNHFKQGH